MSDTHGAGASRRQLLRAAAAVGALAGLTATGSATRQPDAPAVPATLPSARRLDREAGRVTLPVYRGLDPDGDNLYFALTSASTIAEATRQGVNWAPKLANARDEDGVQELTRAIPSPRTRRQAPVPFDATVEFDSTPGSPPAVAAPGYTPLVSPEASVPGPSSGVVYCTPHLVNSTGRHPAVVEFDRDELEVRVDLSTAFVGGRRALYLPAEASTESYARLEGATHTPALDAVPAVGDRSLEASAREALFAVVNGPVGARSPERQGTNSARAGEGDALYVFRSSQVCVDASDPTDCSVFYAPTWGVYELAWTGDAIESDRRRRLTDHEAVIEGVLGGELESATPDGPVDTLLANVSASGAVLAAPLVDVSPQNGSP
ncbi:hypothetical protein [Halorarius halobius]|uniref:hypothetical protein n=1 Tax=Halorarius halobius TaxID=2962671 RepID=UPI0020CC83D5|nr:hypothetical protein [Halorarius halobius]